MRNTRKEGCKESRLRKVEGARAGYRVGELGAAQALEAGIVSIVVWGTRPGVRRFVNGRGVGNGEETEKVGNGGYLRRANRVVQTDRLRVQGSGNLVSHTKPNVTDDDGVQRLGLAGFGFG